MPTSSFEAFIAPARRAPQLWRLVLGAILIAACALVFTLAPLAVIWALRGSEAAMAAGVALGQPDTPRAALMLLFSFAGMALGAALAARLLHGRRAATLFGPRARVRRHFWIAVGVVLAVYALGYGLWRIRYAPEANLDLWRWARLLPLALLAVALQTLAEEMAFRGYLMQQLAARFASPLVWLLLPALAFGLVHFDPEAAGGNAWVVLAAATVFGLVAGDLTARTGSLGAAWGFHFANNAVALLFISTKGTITGLALWQTPYVAQDPAMTGLVLGDIALLLVAWAVLRRVLARA